MSDIDLDLPARGIDWRRTDSGARARERLFLLADAVKAAEAERDAYKAALEGIVALDSPDYYTGVERAADIARSVLAGVVSTREKDDERPT